MENNKSWLTIHQKFTEYGRNAKEWMRKCALLLPQIEKQQIWKKKRFNDIYEYAAKLAGMSRNQVNEALRILCKTESLPALRKVIEERGVNAVKPVIAIATNLTDKFWAEKAEQMGVHTLETYVKEFRKRQSVNGLHVEASPSVNLQNLPFEPQSSSGSSRYLDPQGLSLEQQLGASNSQSSPDSQPYLLSLTRPPAEPSPKITIAMQLDPQIADHLQKIKGQSDWNETIGGLLKLRQEKLDQEKPKVVEDATRPIPAAIEKYALAITNSTCAFPGCYKPYEILHHIDRFGMYHTHDPDRIVPLCEAHERLAHLGLIENENQPPQFWSLRAQPDYNDPKYGIDQVVEKFRQPKG